MKKLFAYYMLLKWTKEPMVAARIYQLLYEGQMIDFSAVKLDESQMKQPSSKKEELEMSLAYLKSKPVKSNKDKESIQMIQAVLNNMK